MRLKLASGDLSLIIKGVGSVVDINPCLSRPGRIKRGWSELGIQETFARDWNNVASDFSRAFYGQVSEIEKEK